jgi:hypothetical protein
MMELLEQVKHMKTREDFVAFLHSLVRDFRERPEQWENTSLEAYLEAMAAWVQDMDGYYRKCGERVPKHLTWKNLGEMLLAARIYE